MGRAVNPVPEIKLNKPASGVNAPWSAVERRPDVKLESNEELNMRRSTIGIKRRSERLGWDIEIDPRPQCSVVLSAR